MIVKLRNAGLRVLRQKRDVLTLIEFCDDRYTRKDKFIGKLDTYVVHLTTHI